MNERMQLAPRGSNVGIWEVEWLDDPNDPQRRYTNVWEQLGYESSPPGKSTVLDVSHPDDRAGIEDLIRESKTARYGYFQDRGPLAA